jgi:MraZ protein
MFLGEHERSLDDKGRVVLPARFRDEFEGGAVMVRSIDGCIAVYTPDGFDRLARKTNTESELGLRGRDRARSVFSGAEQFRPDRQGRVAIPPKLQAHAGLERDIVFVGLWDHIEIWDAQRFRERDAEGTRLLVTGEGIGEDP